MKFTEEQLKFFAAPLSETEQKKCQNAINMVRDALNRRGFVNDGGDTRILYENTYAYGLEMANPQYGQKVKNIYARIICK